jgi:hypothetical protein
VCLCKLIAAAAGPRSPLEWALVEEMAAGGAAWAAVRLAGLQLGAGRYEAAITSFQAAIR